MQPHQYEHARRILAAAGSASANKSHPPHNRDEVPESWGRDLLREAQANFARGGTDGADALNRAAEAMGLSAWWEQQQNNE
ncbi:hypothetical protein ACFV27_34220 [Streptomyces antimycoticus]|uniref:hypothetical protein n=1 Tax=Streptomyces antimycoticus TaxID=68175 RepID=UPI0025703097|nr:hypothetical protein [Streptomyces antimycoticus]WJE00681.1 hypothetical protein QR300_34515 [Streptomyces antimycoticus]